MNIRRKSTAHDLATLRLHPDGSRVQQSSVNAGRRTAGSTVVDPRGNWIARDAGGKSAVKTQRIVVSAPVDDVEREFIDLSDDDSEDARDQSKGKQRAHDDEDALQEPESERLDARTRRRLSFMHDLSFLDPPPVSVSSLKQDSDTTLGRESAISFSDPASDLLKSIHHFASCHYRERGQLFDSGRDYRGKKKERHKQRLQENIHIIAANAFKHQNTDSETEHTETEHESSEEDENESEIAGVEDDKRGPRTKGDTYRKDMYKAFDGSALMAIGIVLQEYVAHTLPSRPSTSEEPGIWKRRRTG